MCLFLLSGTMSAQFEGGTKTKQVKRMTKHQVRKAQKGKSYYVRVNGDLKKRRWYHKL